MWWNGLLLRRYWMKAEFCIWLTKGRGFKEDFCKHVYRNFSFYFVRSNILNFLRVLVDCFEAAKFFINDQSWLFGIMFLTHHMKCSMFRTLLVATERQETFSEIIYTHFLQRFIEYNTFLNWRNMDILVQLSYIYVYLQ